MCGCRINKYPRVFVETKAATVPKDIHQQPRKPTEIAQGVVLTAAEKEKAEAERRRIEEEELKRQEEEKIKERERKEKNKNTFWGKIVKKVKSVGSSMLEPEE